MILVTGGSGFLGGHLVRELSRRGERVRALYNTRKPVGDMASLPGVEWVQADLLDIFDVEAVMKDVTDVYHCAAIVSFDPAKREEMLHFNPESTANIVNQAVEQGIRKLVYVSSVAALGRSGHMNKEADEEQEWGESGYNSAYGISKYLAENEVWRGVGEGLCAAIVCPSLILGAGDWSSGSPQIMTVVNKEFPFYTGGVNGWVGVGDVVNAMVQLMASDIEGERFIVNEGNHAYREIFTMMANALGKKPPRMKATPLMTGIIWRANAIWSRITGANPVITQETASTAHSISLYNNSKLLQALKGFAYTPIDACIAEMAVAFKADHTG
ncbi:MAG: NAD-dependent epimerase/dehydratase family protein [Flavipsychrobacter sp.]|nr:NAD-dependent epimerase/dehydratase family protein [Flavipsychrobacter sp.]